MSGPIKSRTMTGYKRIKIEDLTLIYSDLKMVQRRINNFNEKYNTDLNIVGLDGVMTKLLGKMAEIKEEEVLVDPGTGLTLTGHPGKAEDKE